MKILIVAPDFYPTSGGYSHAITNFVKELSKQDLDILVYTPVSLEGGLDLEIKGVRYIRCPIRKFPLASLMWEFLSYFKLKKIVKKEKIDCILFETAEFGLLGYMFALSNNKNVLVRIHACTETETTVWGKSFYERYRSLFIKAFFRRVRWILSTNSYHIDFYKKFFLGGDIYKIAAKNFFIVPNIVYRQSSEISREGSLLSKYAVNLNKHKILFTLGRLNHNGLIQKGVEDLIYSVFFLKQEVDGETLDKLRIFVVGDGEYGGYVQELAKNLGIDRYFVFVRRADHLEVLELLRVSEGTVLLSRFEGLSMFALEALSQGSPLLFSNTGGIKDLVINGENGFLVDPQSIESIKNGLKKIIKLNGSEIEKMREKSREVYIGNFSPENIARKFMLILKLIKNI
jgi:glycosyltransferase involved in cell wall biosynthesis